MTIFYPIGSLYPAQSGGPANTIYWMAKALQEKGVNVKIVTSNKGISLGEVALDKWLQLDYGVVKYCTTTTHYFPLSLIYNSWKALRSVDVVHLTALFYPPSLLIALRAIILGKSIVWSARGELHPSALQYSTLKKKFYLFILGLLPKLKITFHATSPEEQTLIKKQFGKEIHVIQLPNFIELPAIVTPASTSLYFLFIGRIHPIKGLDSLIEGLALSTLFRKSAYTFQLAGEGEPGYVEVLNNRVNELGLSSKIYFIGSKTGSQKQTLYANAHYTFLLSHSENFGNVVVESLAQSTPVVASKGTPWQMLEELKSGYWIDNSPDCIAETIDKIIRDDTEGYDKMRCAARKLAEDQFDISRNINKWVEAYASISK